MEARLWTRLPAEIVERVLSFLPVRDFGRFSTVCRRWKHLISTPDFGSLCFRYSKGSGRCYIVARYVVEPDVLNDTDHLGFVGWSILDLETKRWCTFKTFDVEEMPQTQEGFLNIQAFGFDKSIMLMSKKTGLLIVCKVCDLESGFMWSQMPTEPRGAPPSRLQSVVWEAHDPTSSSDTDRLSFSSGTLIIRHHVSCTPLSFEV